MTDPAVAESGRSDLPTGVVTFLFTDIEGSTRLLQDLGERYAELLAAHDELMRHAIRAHDGIGVNTEGDAHTADGGGQSDYTMMQSVTSGPDFTREGHEDDHGAAHPGRAPRGPQA